MAARRDDVRVVARAVQRLVEGARRGMSQSFDLNRFAVLATAAQGRLRPIDIADRLDLYPSSVSRHVQALVEAGQVQLIGDQDDRRSSFVVVTDAGHEELRRHEETGLDIFSGVLAEWSDEDIRAFGALLDRFSATWADRGTRQKARVRRSQRDRLPHWVHSLDQGESDPAADGPPDKGKGSPS